MVEKHEARGEFFRRRSRRPDSVDRILLIPIGSVEGFTLDFLDDLLPDALGKTVARGARIESLRYAYNEDRRQYLAEAILLKLGQIRDRMGGRVLGMADISLYRRDGRAVFGHTDRERRVALVSVRFLQDKYYGLREDVKRLQERVLKEAIRQLGHSYGLKGCTNPLCPMFDSHELLDLDIKRPSLCFRCRRAIP